MKQLITSLSLTIVKSLFDFDPASDGSEDFYDQAVTFELQICTLCLKLWPHYVDQRADYCHITVLPELQLVLGMYSGILFMSSTLNVR